MSLQEVAGAATLTAQTKVSPYTGLFYCFNSFVLSLGEEESHRASFLSSFLTLQRK